MPDQSRKPLNETGLTIHSRAYERGMLLLVILATAVVLMAVLYLIPD